MQGMRRRTKNILMRVGAMAHRVSRTPYACASLSRCAICGAS
jgi:hypothetical protein